MTLGACKTIFQYHIPVARIVAASRTRVLVNLRGTGGAIKARRAGGGDKGLAAQTVRASGANSALRGASEIAPRGPGPWGARECGSGGRAGGTVVARHAWQCRVVDNAGAPAARGARRTDAAFFGSVKRG